MVSERRDMGVDKKRVTAVTPTYLTFQLDI